MIFKEKTDASNFFNLLIFRDREEKGGREKHQFLVPLIDGWLLYTPLPGIGPSNLVYAVDALTNQATQPGPNASNFERHITIILSKRNRKREESENIKGIDLGTLLHYEEIHTLGPGTFTDES